MNRDSVKKCTTSTTYMLDPIGRHISKTPSMLPKFRICASKYLRRWNQATFLLAVPLSKLLPRSCWIIPMLSSSYADDQKDGSGRTEEYVYTKEKVQEYSEFNNFIFQVKKFYQIVKISFYKLRFRVPLIRT